MWRRSTCRTGSSAGTRRSRPGSLPDACLTFWEDTEGDTHAVEEECRCGEIADSQAEE